MLPLYAVDDFHPSGMGTYVAALVVYRQIFGEPAPARPLFNASDADGRTLMHAVEATVTRVSR